MSVNLSPLGGAGWQFLDNNGNPLVGGLLYTYAAGTTTPQITYTSASGSTPNPNPVVLDSAGRVANEIWLDAGVSYKFVLRTSTGVLVWTKDDIDGINDVNAENVVYTPSGTGAENTNVQEKLRQTVSVFDFMTALEIADVSNNTGSLDVTQAIQDAINAVYSPAQNIGWGGTLIFPPGTYKTTAALTINKHINIEAYGARINSSGARCFDIGSATYLTNLALGYFRVRIAGLYINHAGANEVIRNQGIRRIVLERVQTIGGSHALYTEGAFDNPVITNCRFQNTTSHCINIAQRNNLLAIYNTAVLGAAGYGIHMNTAGAELKGIKLYSADVEGCVGGIFIGGNTGNVIMDGCWFENNTVFNIRVDNTAGTANKYGISIYNCQITGAGVDVVIGNDAAGTLIDGVEVTACEFVDSTLTVLDFGNKVRNFVQHSNRQSGTTSFAIDSEIQTIRIGRGKGGLVTNTVFGVGAGGALDQSTSLGSQNTFFGYQAGLYCSTGYNNVFVGRVAGINVTTGFSNVAIGNRSMENASTNTNSVAVGNATLASITSGTGNTVVGANAGLNLTTTADAVAVGLNALNGVGVTAMDRCIAIGKEAGATATNGISDVVMIGTQATATGSNAIAIGTGVTAAANTIRMGNAAITTANIQVAWTVTSDARAKEQVSDLDLGLEFAKSLRPVSYRRIGSTQEELGFIAQEVQSAAPRPLGLVQVDDQGVYGLRQNDLIAVLVKAVQELSARVDQLEAAR